MPISYNTSRSGFTLVELLLAMAIIAILAGVTITAINPTRQMADARNTQRKFDVNTLLNAFGQYSIDSRGYFVPRSIDGVMLIDACDVKSAQKKICKPTTPHGTDIGECGHVDVNCVWTRHLSGAYIADIPHDPHDAEVTAADQVTMDYLVRSETVGRFRVDSPNAENGSIIGALR